MTTDVSGLQWMVNQRMDLPRGGFTGRPGSLAVAFVAQGCHGRDPRLLRETIRGQCLFDDLNPAQDTSEREVFENIRVEA